MPPTPSLHRDEIVDAAIAIIERDGVDGLSMRRLAAEVGSKPMTLYHYVDGKPALMRLVLTEVAARIPWVRPSGPPRERMIAVAIDMFDKLAEIPWIVPILLEGKTIGVPALALNDTFISAAYELGVDELAAVSLWRSIWYLVAGELGWRDTVARRGPGEKSWHATIDPAELVDVPTIADLLPRFADHAANYCVRDAVTAQIDGVLTRLSPG